ncbi:MAG: Wzz/FepE/Etk N-terminal domain-containing protein, partial [Fibrobacteria bacterium]
MQGWNKVADGSDAKTERNGNGSDRHGQVSILDLILILLEHKWFILIGMILICGSAVATVLLLQSRYTSTVIVLPSKQKMSSPLGSLMGDMPLGGLLKSFDFLGQGDNNEFLSILDSRRLAEQVVTRFDLIHHYGFHKQR